MVEQAAAVPSKADGPADGEPLAGYYGGTFYLRDKTDNFRLYVQGRAHVDAYVPFGPGVTEAAPGSGLKSTVFLRRIRPEISGEFFKVWQFKIEGDWGQTTNDNANGQSIAPSCSVDASTGKQSCISRSGTIQAPVQRPQTLDVFINWGPSRYFNLQFGQFKIPFTYENRTSENFTPFMEASLPVRNVGAPLNRDIGVMAWGELDAGLLFYSAGIFNGDGPNRLNPDNRGDGIGRVFAHPLAKLDSPLKDLQIGASARYGVRDSEYVGYDYPTFTTQGGFAFWRPAYTDSLGRLTHVIPSGKQRAVAGELFVPFRFVDLTGELIYIDNETREAVDGYQLSPFTERLGRMKGYGYYAQLGVWLLGDRSIIGRRGYSTPTHLDFTKHTKPKLDSGLELLAKFERLSLSYSSAARGGTPDPVFSPDGDIRVNAISVGVNYYLTKHLRLSANYMNYHFPNSAPVSASPKGSAHQTSAQRAVAPAQLLAKGVDDEARATGHALHELMFRVAVAL